MKKLSVLIILIILLTAISAQAEYKLNPFTGKLDYYEPGGVTGATGPGYKATSVSSLAIATGSKTFVTQSGLAYSAGARVRASYVTDTSKYMEGIVASYSTTNLVITVDRVSGSGTYATWNINLVGDVGATGAAGVDGATGAAGQGYTYRGAWVSGTSYVAYDNVTDVGISYVNILATSGTTHPASDGTHWAVFAQKGDPGSSGSQTPWTSNIDAAGYKITGIGGASTLTGNGNVSAPGFTMNGTWYSGGSATTTKPYILIESTGTTSTGWSTSGTGLGINAASGFGGNLIDAQVAGVSRFSVSNVGTIIIPNNVALQGIGFSSVPTDLIKMGSDFNTYIGNNSVGETIVQSGANLYIKSPIIIAAFGTYGLSINNSTAAPPSGTALIVKNGNVSFSYNNAATSGTPVAFLLTPTYNQISGTASNTDFLINRTETAIGSGVQYLQDLQVNSLSLFNITNRAHQNSSPVPLTNIVTNGTFTTNLTGWAGTNWAWSAGTALHTAGNTAALTEAAATVVIGQSYKVTFDVIGRTAGQVIMSVGGAGTTARTTNATFTEYLIATATTAIAFTPDTNFNGAIDNVILQAVGPSLTTCGTAPVLQTGSNDHTGTFTIGAAGTGCILTFGTAYTNVPACVVGGAAAITSSTSNTALTVTAVAGIYSYICNGLNE
jgi:hypothetical protein